MTTKHSKSKKETKGDLLLHPIRLRIIQGLVDRELTPLQLADNLADVPQATLYRHLNKLVDAGIVKVVSERQVRGTVEKVYTVVRSAATLSAADLAKASREDHMRYFTTFVAGLLHDFSNYLHQEKELDFIKDGTGYSQTPLYLSEAEFLKMVAELQVVLLPLTANQPTPERRRILLTTILMPSEPEPAESDPAS